MSTACLQRIALMSLSEKRKNQASTKRALNRRLAGQKREARAQSAAAVYALHGGADDTLFNDELEPVDEQGWTVAERR